MIWLRILKFFAGCAILSVVVTLGGCGENKNILAAKKAIELPLKDPRSVQYKDVIAFKDGVVCGSMNAKNSMGGYVGFEPFIYNYLGEKGRLEGKAGDLQQKIWCNNNSNKMQAENAQRIETAKYILSVTEPNCKPEDPDSVYCSSAERAWRDIETLTTETSVLEWAQSDNGSDIGWNEATAYCKSKGSGWRLPTSAELLASYASGHSTPCGDGTCKFSSNSSLTRQAFWTNEPKGSSEAFIVSLYDGGRIAYQDEAGVFIRALCVRRP